MNQHLITKTSKSFKVFKHKALNIKSPFLILIFALIILTINIKNEIP